MKSLAIFVLVLLFSVPCYGQISFGGRSRRQPSSEQARSSPLDKWTKRESEQAWSSPLDKWTDRFESRQPLPDLNANRYDPNSLSNPYGAGSPYKTDGLMNPYSQQGSRYSNDSWTNPYATNAPKIYSGGTYRGELSKNRFAPDSTSNPYGQYGSRFSPDSINNPYGAGSRYSTQPIYVRPGR